MAGPGVMDERALTPDWLSSWAGRVSQALARMTQHFEHTHGYPRGRTRSARPGGTITRRRVPWPGSAWRPLT